MRVSTLLVAALAACNVVAFGPRGVAERVLYYLLYLGEELLEQGDMRLAIGCPGSRTGFNGAPNRCYLSEFLKWIEPENGPIDLDKVGILKSSNEIGQLRLEDGTEPHFWGEQQELVDLVHQMSNPESAITVLQDAVENCVQLELKTGNPPNARNTVAYDRWKAANPGWSSPMPTGEGKTQPIVMLDKNNNPSFKAVGKPPGGERPYRRNLYYEHLDGIARDTSPAKFQEFFATLNDYQNRIDDRVRSLSDNSPAKERGLKLLSFISTSIDFVIEMRVVDYWRVTINGPDKVPPAIKPEENPDKDTPGMSEEEKARRLDIRNKIRFGMKAWFKDGLDTIPMQGRWMKYEVPNKESTIEHGKQYFSSEAEARELFDAFFNELNSAGIEHSNVISTVKEVGDRFKNHQNYEPTLQNIKPGQDGSINTNKVPSAYGEARDGYLTESDPPPDEEIQADPDSLQPLVYYLFWRGSFGWR
ncbi:hypothetical protein NLG97_g6508 [Lecanicillium saksenae]|uniref:Uncharacterized protein n=1 Tax=Lecanicillium saksenae TaxID=468837 RepID=A0ACC1QPJ2_9HYPO|nr:hypothetical protein NLG97_g6508 [Lecanicillium saksenae]